jgi:AraC-like DNA-binding protein
MTKNNESQTFSTPEIDELTHYGKDVPRPIVTRPNDYAIGRKTGLHWHVRAQLLYASKGVMKVSSAEGSWVVVPQRAVWIPATERHDLQTLGPISLRSLFIQPDAAQGLPTECCVVNVSPLLRELILAACALPKEYVLGGREEHIMMLILDEIRAVSVAPLYLPEPTDPRLVQMSTAIRESPADNRSLDAWGRMVGASSRTLARLFLSETGLTFRQWQQQARLLESLVRLADGQAVTTVAMEVGYDSTSAFIAMFRRGLGTTPKKYFAIQS